MARNFTLPWYTNMAEMAQSDLHGSLTVLEAAKSDHAALLKEKDRLQKKVIQLLHQRAHEAEDKSAKMYEVSEK